MSLNFEEISQTIIEKNTDIAEVTKNLQTLREEFETQNTALTNLNDKIKLLENDNEKLKQTNLEYFFKLGHTKKEEENKEPPIGGTVEPKKYESLFDDKGNLK